MKKLLMIFVIVSICTVQIPQAFAGPSDPLGSGAGGNTVDWYYWSPLTVTETITDLGGGMYQYDFLFTNVDTSPIWAFDVLTDFATSVPTLFTGHPGWGSSSSSVGSVFAEYDGRNLDPAILYVPHTWSNPWVDPVTSIQIGESASGFSFTASVYDPSAKYYFYETIASGYTQTNGTGKVAAVGLTEVIPAPGAILLGSIGAGLVGWLRRRKTL